MFGKSAPFLVGWKEPQGLDTGPGPKVIESAVKKNIVQSQKYVLLLFLVVKSDTHDLPGLQR